MNTMIFQASIPPIRAYLLIQTRLLRIPSGEPFPSLSFRRKESTAHLISRICPTLWC
jgi:hypothetical protein